MAKAKATLVFQSHLWHVHFHVLNNPKNAASLNNLLLLEGFPKRLKLEDGGSYLHNPNSTSFIDTTHATLVEAVCIYAGYFHTKKQKKKNR